MINKRTVNGSVILDIAEASDLEVLQTCILETLHQGQHRLALNLCCLDFTESTDLAILMLAYKVCCEDGGDLVLYGLKPYALRLMQITRLDQVLRIYETEAEALAALDNVVPLSPLTRKHSANGA